MQTIPAVAVTIVVSACISGLALVVSIITAAVTLRDRRPNLTLRERDGHWLTLRATTRNTLGFEGVVEVYNSSTRGNAIRRYRFLEQIPSGQWHEMVSEPYEVVGHAGDVSHANETPFALPPYSGAGIRVGAFSRQATALQQLRIRIEMEDLFENTYRIEVVTTVNPQLRTGISDIL